MPRAAKSPAHRRQATVASRPTRLKILAGAASAFGDRGFADATVGDIIEAAGVSRPSFYKFFRNKDEVFDLLQETHLLSLIQLVKGAARAVTATDAKIEQAAEAYLRWIVATGPLARTISRIDAITSVRRPSLKLGTLSMVGTGLLLLFGPDRSQSPASVLCDRYSTSRRGSCPSDPCQSDASA